MKYSLRLELMDELNLFKGILKEAENIGEIHQDERLKIMNNIGQIKTILYKDYSFKRVYTSTEYRPETVMDRKKQRVFF